MKIYLYDGTFEGYLTSVFCVFEQRVHDAEIISETHFNQQTLFEIEYVSTDAEKASRVYETLTDRISKNFLRDIYYIYLADTEQCGTVALGYIRLGLKCGNEIYNFNHTEEACRALKLKNRVMTETHRLKGLLRFRKFKEILLADIEPDHNILTLIYPHFMRRMPGEDWIIRDNKRSIAAMCFDGKCDVVKCEQCDVEITDEYEDIWREFYHAIAIKERDNPRLRKNFMPVRYWKNIVEL